MIAEGRLSRALQSCTRGRGKKTRSVAASACARPENFKVLRMRVFSTSAGKLRRSSRDNRKEGLL
jgi:hypothetical protein